MMCVRQWIRLSFFIISDLRVGQLLILILVQVDMGLKVQDLSGGEKFKV